MSIARNLHRRRGAPVPMAAIAAEHRPRCKDCSQGIQRRHVPGPTPHVAETVCGCAAGRFIRKHPEVIVSEEGYAWWPAPEDEQPQPKQAPPMAALATAPADDDLPAGPDPGGKIRTGRLLNVQRRKEAEEAMLRAVEHQMEEQAKPHRQRIQELSEQLVEIDRQHDCHTVEVARVMEEIATLSQDIELKQDRLRYLAGAHSDAVNLLIQRCLDAKVGVRTEIEREGKAANEKTARLRKRALPLQQHVASLARRLVRLRAYGGETQPPSPNGSGHEAV